ncbi:MAG: hypothetical protein JNK05_06940 [Myxococcales bacterium]|nr:hypothetical protein [Myxococcales bacterium]
MLALRSLTTKAPSQCRWTRRGAARALAASEALVVTGGDDGSLCVYTHDGALVASRVAHESAVIAVGFARDDATGDAALVSVGRDGRMVVSDLALVEQRALALPGVATALATDARSSRVAVVIAEQSVVSGSIHEGLEPWPKLTDEPITGIVAIDDGERFVRSTIGALWVTDARGALVRTIAGHGFASDELHSVTVRPHPDRRRVLVDASGEAMRLYTTRDVWALDVDTDERVKLSGDSSTAAPWVARDGRPIEFVARPAASSDATHRVLAPGASVTACVAVDIDSVFTIQTDRSLKRYSLRPVESKSPAAGSLVRGFDRVPGELWTWDRATRSVHRFSASDGAWIDTARGKHLENEQLVLSDDGSLFVANAPSTPLVSAVIERWNARGEVTFRADGDYELPRAAALSERATHAVAVAHFHQLEHFSPEESAVFVRDTPHREWGGAACVRDDLVVSYDRQGSLVGWSVDSSTPRYTTRIEKTPCAILPCRDGRSVAILLERASRELELVWLDADTGAVLQRSQRAKASIASTLVEREDGSVASAGVPPVVFDRVTGEARVATSVREAYCTMIDPSGRYAIVQNFQHERLALDIDADVLRPLDGCRGSATYTVTSFVSRDGPRFVLSGLGGEAMLIDPVNGRVLARKVLHEGGILALAATRDGSKLLSSGSDRRVRVYDGATLALEREHAGPKSSVFYAQIDEAATGESRAFVWGYDASEGHRCWAFDLDREGSLPPRPVERRGDCASARERATRGRWSLSTQTRAVRFDLARGVIDAQVAVRGRHPERSSLSECGRWLVLRDVTETCLIDLDRGVVHALDKSFSQRGRFAFGPRSSGSFVLVAAGAELRLIDDARERFCVRVADDPAKIERVAAASNATAILVLSCKREAGVAWWIEARAARDGSRVWRRELDASAVRAFAVARGRVAIGDADGRVRVFNEDDGELVAGFESTESVEDLGLLDQGRVVVIDGAGALQVLGE